MHSSPITVIIADPQIITRNGLAKTLEAIQEIQVVAITGCSNQLICLCDHHQPDIIMISANLPGVNNMKPYRYITETYPGIPVIIVADDNDAETIIAMKTAGEFAWLYTSATGEKIATTLQDVHDGTYKKEQYNGYNTNAINRALLHTLTPREKEMLIYFGDDLTAKEIAAKQNLSTRTIEGHKEKLKEKLQVMGTAGLTKYALLLNTYLPTLLYWLLVLFTNDMPDVLLIDLAA